ncbi:hypothetical protein HMPREF9512_03022 [Enterococcus faecalis EnGen0311]|nr:hypothetical protein HMPREF9512_03022 [Enterococcus faecalis EnGen0311]
MKTEKRNQTNRPSSKNEPNQTLGVAPLTPGASLSQPKRLVGKALTKTYLLVV